MVKGKNVEFDAEKWKNEMTHPGFEPWTISNVVRCPYPYTTDSLVDLAKNIKRFIIQFTAVTKSC